MMVVIKAINELFAVDISLVLWAPIPKMNVGINNEYLFSGLRCEHKELTSLSLAA
jgi:hypothetical protein